MYNNFQLFYFIKVLYMSLSPIAPNPPTHALVHFMIKMYLALGDIILKIIFLCFKLELYKDERLMLSS